MNDVDTLPPPRDVRAPRSFVGAGCAFGLCLALLPVLYVGSFAYLYADAQNRWGLMASVDKRTFDFFHDVYWPLIWVWQGGQI